MVKIIIFIILFAVLVFVAYNVAGPLIDFLNGRIEPKNNTSSLSLVSSQKEDTSSADKDQTSSQPVKNQSGKQQTIVMPQENLLDQDALKSFVDNAKTDGYTSVVVLLKDETGILAYNSSLEEAEKYNSIGNKKLKLSDVVKVITDRGLQPVAQIHTFKDKTAANRENDNTFKLKGQNVTWWDNSPSSGGKPWLNPYKKNATEYLLSVMGEIYDAGFKQIVLDSVQFPDVRNTANIEFPSGANKETHQEALANFIQSAQELAKEKNASVTVAYNTLSILDKKDNIYFGNPLNLNAATVSPIINTGEFGSKLEVGDITIDKPSENVKDTIKVIIDRIQSVSDQTEIIPIIADEANKTKIITELKALGIESYIVK
jgi:hypothetical protein